MIRGGCGEQEEIGFILQGDWKLRLGSRQGKLDGGRHSGSERRRVGLCPVQSCAGEVRVGLG